MLFRLNDLFKVTDPGSVNTKLLQAISEAHCILPVTSDASVGSGSVIQAGAAEQEQGELAERTRAFLLQCRTASLQLRMPNDLIFWNALVKDSSNKGAVILQSNDFGAISRIRSFVQGSESHTSSLLSLHNY